MIKDIQSLTDTRGIDVQKVGVDNVHLPFLLKCKNGEHQPVLAKIRLTVGLPHNFKGTHMSRFIEVLNKWSQKPINSDEIGNILREITMRTDAQGAHIEMSFKYFLPRVAPVSGCSAILDYDITFQGELDAEGNYDFVLGAAVPITSLCPCSKEISRHGAHNQRSTIYAQIRYECPVGFIWIEDLIDMIERQASAPVYPILKREDEKHVTEQAYENPKFVEDIIRDIVLTFRAHPYMTWFDVECSNHESIHNHDAYARHTENIERGTGG